MCLVTGAAGFIGFHVCQSLLRMGNAVLGVDNMNDYYDVELKKARLSILQRSPRFRWQAIDIASRAAMEDFGRREQEIEYVIHLAAQAGVRYSLSNPHVYSQSNVVGQVEMLEFARHAPGIKHFIYASSSSVYGSNENLPFSESDNVDHPVSLYAATKKACELIAHTYSHLFGIPTTGLRLFTVYGPWGRPDMAPFIIIEKILAGKPLTIFNHGDMRRDFTYIDDIVAGILAAAVTPPVSVQPPYKVYNLGNGRSESLMGFIEVIEKALGKKAKLIFADMQPGDVKDTYADIRLSEHDLGFRPTTTIEIGIPKFVKWYKEHFAIEGSHVGAHHRESVLGRSN